VVENQKCRMIQARSVIIFIGKEAIKSRKKPKNLDKV